MALSLINPYIKLIIGHNYLILLEHHYNYMIINIVYNTKHSDLI